MIDVILPAGGRISGEFAAEAGAEVKALIEVGGRTVLQRTLDALRATGQVRRAIVIGPHEIADHACAKSADAVLPEGGDSGPANILRGIEWLSDTDGSRAGRVLIVTTDLPFLTPEAISTFIDSCPPDIDLCLPLVSKKAFEKRFPGSDNQYVKLADGSWTLGCGFLVNPEAIESNRDQIERVFAARKSQIGMARLLGLGFIIRFLTGRLSVSHIEKRCTHMLGCSGKAIPGSCPELAFDLDNIGEYRYAAQHRG
jgi:GTP:adenosylcobinamide-phosphate guanylyltransferase